MCPPKIHSGHFDKGSFFGTLSGRAYPGARHKVSEDVIEFFKGMERMDERVARKLNEEHERRVEQINQSRKEKPVYEPEDKVWFKRPAGLTAGLVSVWEKSPYCRGSLSRRQALS